MKAGECSKDEEQGGGGMGASSTLDNDVRQLAYSCQQDLGQVASNLLQQGFQERYTV